jgi:hypothetical protein
MGGFHTGGFQGGGFRGDGFHDHGFGRLRGGFGVLGWPYYAYPYGSDYYPDYRYDWGQYGNSYTWYYCSDPAGYYPYVAQCIPAGRRFRRADLPDRHRRDWLSFLGGSARYSRRR